MFEKQFVVQKLGLFMVVLLLIVWKVAATSKVDLLAYVHRWNVGIVVEKLLL